MSVIVPAHNEAATITRLLEDLLDEMSTADIEIVVVCNGCTDDTARRAGEFGPSVCVIETPVPSKAAALRLGDSVAARYPRVYVDADVQLGAADLRALGDAIVESSVLAAAPRRELVLDGSSWAVRRYYEIWQQLPQVRTGLFGRGVIALSADGHARVRALPDFMSDDLAISEAFRDSERVVVDAATARVYCPRTLRDLIRRRIRVATGTAQFDAAGRSATRARTSFGTVFALIAERPRQLPATMIFVLVTVVARLGARRRVRSGDFTTWLRDESSRRNS